MQRSRKYPKPKQADSDAANFFLRPVNAALKHDFKAWCKSRKYSMTDAIAWLMEFALARNGRLDADVMQKARNEGKLNAVRGPITQGKGFSCTGRPPARQTGVDPV